MQNNKILTLLGFASKAGRLSFGMNAALEAIKCGKAKLILGAGDVSKKSLKEMAFYADKGNVKHIALDDISITTVSNAVGHKCGIIAINDSGFADAIIKAHAQGGNANDE